MCHILKIHRYGSHVCLQVLKLSRHNLWKIVIFCANSQLPILPICNSAHKETHILSKLWMKTSPYLPDFKMVMFFKYTPIEDIIMLCFLLKRIKSLKSKFKAFPKKQTIFWPKTIILELLAKKLINIHDNCSGCLSYSGQCTLWITVLWLDNCKNKN